MTSWGPAFPRIARWMGNGLGELGARADIVYLDQAPAELEGSRRPDGHPSQVRQVELGARRARSALPRLVRYLHDRRPSVTLATPGTVGFLAILAGGLTRQRVLPWEQTVPLLDRADTPRRLGAVKRAADVVYGRAPLVVAVSQGVRDALVADLAPRLQPERLVVIPNPVDGDEIRRLAAPPAPRSRGLRLCSIGRLVTAKGFDVLIHAVSLARLGDDWELIIVGDGPLRSDIERSVAERGLSGHVHLVGRLTNPYPLLASADLAVQASRWEGFGIAVLEALALGVPLIATACPGGVPEILDHGRFGVLVAPDDPEELAGAIRLVLDDEGLRTRLAERGPSRASAYAPSRVAQQLVDLVDHAPYGAGARARRPVGWARTRLAGK